MPKIVTAFCREITNTGTTWISAITVPEDADMADAIVQQVL